MSTYESQYTGNIINVENVAGLISYIAEFA